MQGAEDLYLRISERVDTMQNRCPDLISGIGACRASCKPMVRVRVVRV